MRPRLTGIAELANFIDYNIYFFIFLFMHITQPEIAVDHREEFYFSERQHCSYHENRQREDRDFDRFND